MFSSSQGMISWNHPTNITSPVPSCQNASPLVLFLPKIRWSSSDLPRVLPGVDRWSLTRWLHPHSKMAPSPIFAVSQETRLWSSLRSSVVSLDNLPSNCSVNSSRVQVFFAHDSQTVLQDSVICFPWILIVSQKIKHMLLKQQCFSRSWLF